MIYSQNFINIAGKSYYY